jgi:hypothetical protein
MNSVGGMNDLRGDFVWLHGSRRVAESAEENKPNGGRHSTENSEEPFFFTISTLRPPITPFRRDF